MAAALGLIAGLLLNCLLTPWGDSAKLGKMRLLVAASRKLTVAGVTVVDT